MAIVSKTDRTIGLIGLLAIITYLIVLIYAIIDLKFEFGVSRMAELHNSDPYTIGCILAGVFGIAFGSLQLVPAQRSMHIMGDIRSALIVFGSLVLIATSIVKGEDIFVTAFIVIAFLAMLADAVFNWITGQPFMLIISGFLAIVIGGLYTLYKLESNVIMEFTAIVFIVIWVLFLSILMFSPSEVAASSPIKKEKGPTPKYRPQTASPPKAEPKKDVKKSSSKSLEERPVEPKPVEKPVAAPAPQPKPVEAPQAKPMEKPVEKPVEKPQPKPVEKPVEAPAEKNTPVAAPAPQPKPVEKPVEPNVEAQAAPAKESPLNKFNVVSSRQAAEMKAKRQEEDAQAEFFDDESGIMESSDIAIEDLDPADEQPDEEPVVVEAKADLEMQEEDVDAEEDATEEGEEDFDYEFDDLSIEATPADLVRRAAWNKGLRCRRDYGEHSIPAAFVKGRVAVYVDPAPVDDPLDSKLKEEGWTVLRYVESEVTDGKAQGEEIKKIVSENIKAAARKRKKRSTKGK